MHRAVALLSAILVPLAIAPGWTGEERLQLPAAGAVVTAERVALYPDAPARTQVSGLTFLGGIALSSRDRAFGGFSAMRVAGDRITMLSDGGTVLRFRLTPDWRIAEARLTALPAGPRTGWRKRDRDAESMAVDPATGRIWVGFESVNEVWRFAPGFAGVEARAKPEAMRRWRTGGGMESLARLADGRFVALAEQALSGETTRRGLVWAGDPAVRPPAFAFCYAPAPGYDPSDLTQLPDGQLLVVERAFGLPFNWYARLVLVDARAVRPGATVSGRLLARIASPMLSDNFEGVAATREAGGTAIWLASDDNQTILERTLLLKFRLNAERSASPERRGP